MPVVIIWKAYVHFCAVQKCNFKYAADVKGNTLVYSHGHVCTCTYVQTAHPVELDVYVYTDSITHYEWGSPWDSPHPLCGTCRCKLRNNLHLFIESLCFMWACDPFFVGKKTYTNNGTYCTLYTSIKFLRIFCTSMIIHNFLKISFGS